MATVINIAVDHHRITKRLALTANTVHEPVMHYEQLVGLILGPLVNGPTLYRSIKCIHR